MIDPTHVDRFGHRGETIIPGSGERWGHLDSRVGKPMQPWEEEEFEVLPNGQEVVKNKVSAQGRESAHGPLLKKARQIQTIR